MPLMRSLRAFRLATTTGHVILFKPDTPVFVPDVAVSEAMQAGCVPVDESDTPFIEDLSRAKVEFQGDVRRSMVYLAVKAVVERNNAKEFDGGGTPKASVISDALGFEIGNKEVQDVFQLYLQAKNEDVEFALHPHADNIQLILLADTKGELLQLAEEFGVDAAKAKGLVMRDLRKLLLTKFSGITA